MEGNPPERPDRLMNAWHLVSSSCLEERGVPGAPIRRDGCKSSGVRWCFMATSVPISTYLNDEKKPDENWLIQRGEVSDLYRIRLAG